MKKLSTLLTITSLLVCLMTPSLVSANPVGGLLSHVISDDGKVNMTDGDPATSDNQFWGPGPFGVWTLKKPVTIDAFYQKTGGGTIALYDSKGTLVYQTSVVNSVTDTWTVITPVLDVKTVRVIASYGTGSAMSEMDIRTAIPSIDLVNGYNNISSKLTVMNYDPAKSVQQNLILPYGYDKEASS